MLKYVDYDIVFQEIPDEVTLAVNLSGCPVGCPGCHSSFLREDVGEELTCAVLDRLLEKYGRDITCLCFMGGDGAPQEVAALAAHLKEKTSGKLKTGWYSGRSGLPQGLDPSVFDYIKLGPYIQEKGGLRSPTTNQKLYKVVAGSAAGISGQEIAVKNAPSFFLQDVTSVFWKK